MFRSNRTFLPTGAPTSPIICNIALTPIDKAIYNLVTPMGYRYSRYMDDIYISTEKSKRNWELIDNVKNLLKNQGFHVNRKKTRWMTPNSNDSIIITGVQLGSNRVPKQFRKKLRARLNNLARDNKALDEQTQGCLAYVSSIDPMQYKKFLNYYHQRVTLYEQRSA